MHTNSFYSQLIKWVVTFCLTTLAATCHSSEIPESLSFSMSSSKEQWLLGEPVVIQIAITNTSTSPQSTATQFRNGIGVASYHVSKDGRSYETVGALSYRDPVPQRLSLAPGEAFYHEEVLLFDSRTSTLVFPELGRYFVYTEVSGRKSNVLRIQVVEPESSTDKKWAELLRPRDILIAMTDFTAKPRDAAKLLTECSETTSTFSPYAAFFLATCETNKVNALALFAKCDIAGFPLRSQSLLRQAGINEQLGDTQRARDLYERILREFPNTAAAAEARKIQ